MPRWSLPSIGSPGHAGTDRTAWIVAGFLLLGVLAPTGAVLWFVHAITTSESEGLRLKLADAYRGHLRLLRERVDAEWHARLDRVRHALDQGHEAAFARVVLAGDADAIIVYDPEGGPAYPSLTTFTPPGDPESGPDWWRATALEDAGQCAAAAAAFGAIARRERDGTAVARATQAEMRCLLRLGDRRAVVRLAQERFLEGAASRGTDRHGRLIAADARLLAIEVMPPGEERHDRIAQLAARLNDYDGTSMPAHQRLFVMRRLLELAPDLSFPTLDAEQLAAGVLAGDVSHALAFPIGSADRSAVALFRPGTLLSITERLVRETPAPPGVLFAISEDPLAGPGDAVSLGDMLPGHHLVFRFLDVRHDALPPLASVASTPPVPADVVDPEFTRRVALYAWAGYLAIALLGLAGFVLWRTFRRQQRITQLRTDLLAAVSHELRTPLATMRLLIDSLVDDEEEDHDRTRRYLGMVAEENARLSRLVEQFLAFSRMERNRHRFEFAIVAPRDIVETTVQALGARLGQPPTDLRVEVAPDLPLLHADRDALTTMLLNLLDNAYKYASEDRRIVLRALREGTRPAFEVEDNGIGIAARERQRIFQRFYQVDRRLSRDTGGCGLGLTIVDFIVRAHGGVVSVASEPGRGSRFRVTLPACAADRDAVA